MEQEIIKVLKQYSVKYKQLHATEDDLVVIGDHFQEISKEVAKIISSNSGGLLPLAVRFGYKQYEQGNNLEYALIEFNKLIGNDR